ncbi:uncharacterized protein LOC111657516 isoform X1 [Seriola lalandi dorsalis]|uniref:uncharacterized protein LOC111657516 isoform X1 n=1 Tax=Seriola lalandi dorsalis TaxID=1841481 RepID=UPI000C6F8CFA|nr:uncharacterized protein LOC111657516 isoform X1 [Seriola lalandi dorsalis]XP_056259907.1 uncharacterized protein LOC130186677 isoform X1 [Seriola aureovittata]
MEVSPFSFTLERYWTEEKERALIAFFSKHSCLWNHKSESYKNRQLRWKTLEQLRILLSAHPPPVPFTVEDIKNKFKNLRTTFQRQYKMVKASKVCKGEDVFVPQWKHYQQLMFLQGCWDQDDCVDEQPLSPLTLPQAETQSVLTSPGLIISFLPTPSTSFPSTSSSCVPSNMMVKCYWTEERERALIAFYSEHNCLWNKKSENHNNRQLRLSLLEALRGQLSDHSVSFTVEDIKCKFKNLRTVFNREYKAVQASSVSNKLYVSKWKHYQQLFFLCESCDEDNSTDNLQILMPQEDEDLDNGNQTPSSTLSSLSSSSTQTNSIKVNKNSALSNSSQSNDKTHTAAYQILISASPDSLKLANQTAPSTFPVSLSTSSLDTKPCSNPSPLNFSVSGPVQSDSRLSTDPRCHWSEDKVQQLISFYSEQSCLWNNKSESYRNRLLRQSLLETLSRLLSENEPVPFTVEDIKTKFRNLRTIFQREHKAVSSNKTCGSEDFYLPKWKHYQELMFLCDSCDEDERPEGLHCHQPEESDLLHLDSQAPPSSLHYHTATQTATKGNITPQSLKAPPSPTPPDSQHSSPSSSPSPSTSSSHTNSRLSGRKRASRRAPPTMNEMLDFMRMFCQSRAVSPHTGFMKYVEECLNEMPPDKVKKLKKKIIETIHSVSEEV